MDSSDNFEINYWGKEFSYSNQPKEGRSIKKRLVIVLIFIVLLAVAPTLIFNLRDNKQDEKQITSAASIPTKEPTPSPTATLKQGVVIRNDSYWKISKRYCGTGIYYLANQEKNNSKPLFEGDSVEVICN